ncbi:hypothetical protein SAMN05216509_3922 [Pseudomonas sp. B10]|nr:hypothetical protein SAMN05216509_3922 [Pseudomonas sp. B10]
MGDVCAKFVTEDQDPVTCNDRAAAFASRLAPTGVCIPMWESLLAKAVCQTRKA